MPSPHPPPPPFPDPAPQYIAVECRVCQTRMYGGPDQVGKPITCPDCGALTVLPSPKPPKPKKPPAALEGEQYEVWAVDEQPLPSALAAAQPTYISVVCRVCSTLMYATVDQVGQPLTCPDCRTQNVVPPPAKRKRAKSVLVSDKESLQIDPSRDPGERPVVVSAEVHHLLYEQEEATERTKQAATKAKRRRKHVPKTDARGRPIMPRLPLLTGVVPFLFHPGTRVRWIVLSSWLFVDLALLTWSVTSLQAVGSSGGGLSGGIADALAAVSFLAIGGIIAVLWLAAATSILVTIVTESSEGNNRVEQWPSMNFMEWFSDLLYVVVAILISAFPGWLLAQFTVQAVGQEALWVAGSILFCFPLMLLSQLAVSSPWAVLSGKVLVGFLRRPFSCLLFYIESALLAAICTAAVVYTAPIHHLLPVLFAPLYVAALLVYFRLLGRLGWRIAESASSAHPGQDGRAI